MSFQALCFTGAPREFSAASLTGAASCLLDGLVDSCHGGVFNKMLKNNPCRLLNGSLDGIPIGMLNTLLGSIP